ncbi:MAG: hypothetical protein IKR27_08315 [Lachnospiraceae bacterium]|nr:hypothetical protein [Lachnospiraceae bacterium]
MFWNKNDDINKDWKDYEKYKKEKEARDRELYGNEYPMYSYNENEHHVHDDHCDIGVRTPGQTSNDQLKKIRAAIVVGVIIVVVLTLASRAANLRKWFHSSKEKEIPVLIYYSSKLDGFSIYDVKNVDNKIEVEIKKLLDSDLESAEIEFAFFDKNGKVLQHNVSQISVLRMKKDTTKTAKSIKIPSDSTSVLVKLREPTS